MAEQSELLKSAEQAAALRARWQTIDGSKIRDEIIKRIRANDETWIDLPQRLETPEELRLHGDSSTHMLEDLRGITLDGLDLSDVDLSFTDLSYSFSRHAKLGRVSLQGSTLNVADFTGSDLNNADMLQVKALQARFDLCDLTNAVLMAAVCEDASFYGTNLKEALLDNGRFSRSDFTSANLTGTGTRRAQLDSLVFSTETQGLVDLSPVLTVALEQFTPEKYNSRAYWAKFRQMAHEFVPTAADLVKLWAPNVDAEPILSDALFQIALSWHPNIGDMSRIIVERCVMGAVRNKILIEDIQLTQLGPERGNHVDWIFVVDSHSSSPSAVWPEANVVAHIDNTGRDMFTRFYAMGETQHDVAESYGVSPGHVKYELEKARKAIELRYAAFEPTCVSASSHCSKYHQIA